MAKLEVNVTLHVGATFLSDILVTAFDGSLGGSSYWAEGHRVLANGKELSEKDLAFSNWDTVLIRDKPEGTNLEVNILHVIKGLEIVTKESPRILDAVVREDAGEIDAGDADWIVQSGLFGEQVYG